MNITMKNRFWLLVCALVCMVSAHAQLIWKISGKELSKPSYILGTYHLGNVPFIESLKGWPQAFNETDQVYGEVVTKEMLQPQTIAKMQQAAMLPGNQTLPDLLTPDELSRLNACLKQLLGTDFTNEMLRKQMGQLSPGALATQLTMVLYLKNHMGEFDPTQSMDNYVQELARKNNQPVGALETIDQQIQLLYKSKSLEQQKKDLMCFVDNTTDIENATEALVKAYYTTDLNKLKEAMDQKMNNDCNPSKQEQEQLLDNRNMAWMQKMPAIMQQRPTLFVVGAGHLVGEKGVLQLLRNAGYEVTAP